MTRKEYTERTNEIVEMVQSANFTWEDYEEAVNYSPWIQRVEWWIHEDPNDDEYEHVLTPFQQGNYMEESYFNISCGNITMDIQSADELTQYFSELKDEIVTGILDVFLWNMEHLPEIFDED